MTDILTSLGLSQVHVDLANVLIKAAPKAQPSMTHEDWHAWAVDKLKVISASVFFIKVEHWAAHALVALVYGKVPALEAIIPATTTENTVDKVIDAQSQASVSLTESPFTPAATLQSAKGSLAAVLGNTQIIPKAPTS